MIILPQFLQMKEITNEPETQRKRREKQVLDNFATEIELLDLRGESQEAKYQQIDAKMVEEIDKRTSGQLQINVKKLWQKDCDRNADISKRRWESRNAPWLTNYGEGFKKKYEDKNPYIKQEGPQQTYAQIVANNNGRNQSPRGPSRYPVPAPRPAVNQTQ